MWSGKTFKRDLDSVAEYNPLLGVFDSDEESSVLRTPVGALQAVRQSITRIPNPSTPPPPSPPPHTPTPTPRPPSFNMANMMKMSVFKRLGTKDHEQFWFVADAIWKAQWITDDGMKKVQLVTALQDRALSWYIKFCLGKTNATMLETQQALKNEFKKPKLQA